MTVKLNTENRRHIAWQYEQLNFRLLGGLKIEGLEGMRVTLKVEYKQQAVRHNLDLYNNDSLDKLVRWPQSASSNLHIFGGQFFDRSLRTRHRDCPGLLSVWDDEPGIIA